MSDSVKLLTVDRNKNLKGEKGEQMNEKTLLEAVVLAGELMLVSGAEIYRVEDTMNHMLKRSEYELSLIHI